MRTLVAIALAIVAPAALAHSAGSRDAGEWFLIALLFAGQATPQDIVDATQAAADAEK